MIGSAVFSAVFAFMLGFILGLLWSWPRPHRNGDGPILRLGPEPMPPFVARLQIEDDDELPPFTVGEPPEDDK